MMTDNSVDTLNNSDSWDLIKASHALTGEPDELDQYYEKWATTYDMDVQREDYCAPRYIVDFFTEVLEKSGVDKERRLTLEILDAGCGTGLVGIALQQKGYQTIYGCDLSQKMIEQAQQTGAYRSLIGDIDLNQIMAFNPRQYDAILSCGVFTLGHVPPTALEQLIRITKVGGLIVVSTRKSYCETTDFQAVCERLIADGKIIQVAHVNGPYIAEEGAHYWAFKVC